MDDRPFQTYLFLYHFPRGPGGGGMEHAYSTAIDINAQSVKDNPARAERRDRPRILPSVEREAHPPAVARAGRLHEGKLHARVVVQRGRDQHGRGHHSASRRLAGRTRAICASWESRSRNWNRGRPISRSRRKNPVWMPGWRSIRYYRQPARSISYYNKGELLGVMLDLAVREASHGTASLRDVFQWMNENYAKQGKFFPDSDGVRRAAKPVATPIWAAFFPEVCGGHGRDSVGRFSQDGGPACRPRSRTRSPIQASSPPTISTPRPRSFAYAGQRGRARRAEPVDDVSWTSTARRAAADFERRIGELRPGDMIRLRSSPPGVEHEMQWKLGSQEQVEFEVKDLDNVTHSAEGSPRCLAERRSAAHGRLASVIRTVLMLTFWTSPSGGGADRLSLDFPHARHPLPLPHRHVGRVDGREAGRREGGDRRGSRSSIPHAPISSCRTTSRTSIRRSCCR